MRVFRWIKFWSSTISVILTSFSLIYVVYSTNRNTQLVTETIKNSKEQLTLRQKSIPAQFEMTYRSIGTFKEQAFINNTGKTTILNVRALYKFYFIDDSHKVHTGSSIQKKLKNDKTLLDKVIKSGLINGDSGFSGLLGTSRYFFINEIEPKKETLLDISSSSIQNSMRLANALKWKLFTRWNIKYNEELSNKEIVLIKTIWLNDIRINKSSIMNYRTDLKDVSGGGYVTDLIEDYERNTKEVIFAISK
jgi:hypothetical protein